VPLKIFSFLLILLLAQASPIIAGAYTFLSIPDNEDLYAVNVIDTQKVIIAGEDGYVASSNTRGKYWQEGDIDDAHVDFQSIFFIDNNYGWLSGGHPSYNVVRKSQLTGGQSTKEAQGQIFVTSDGGKTWQMQFEDELYVSHVSFFDLFHGVAVGSYDKFLRTSDGGLTWKPVPVHEKNDFNSISFIGDGHVIAAGNNAVLTASVDKGKTWFHFPHTFVNGPLDQDSIPNQQEYAIRGGFTYTGYKGYESQYDINKIYCLEDNR